MKKNSKKLAILEKGAIDNILEASNHHRMPVEGIDPILDKSAERKRRHLQTIEDIKNCVPRLTVSDARKVVIDWYLFAKDQIEKGATIIPWKDLIQTLNKHSVDLELIKSSVTALATYMEKIESGEISPLPPPITVKTAASDTREEVSVKVRGVYGSRPKGEHAAK